ncbi:MAG TPA: LamG domain-containing protein [Roseiflexaceae bacterium]|nr:LamG domain-containing protein [Roseiflexaceae bacterium]HMP42783.1 LamG domain-containing protein [Roseiflexaceae bacterium]
MMFWKTYRRRIALTLGILIFAIPALLLSAGVPASAAGEQSLRFLGSSSNGSDRVRIPVENKPINITGDFTIEFWMKASAADNNSGPCDPSGFQWVYGNVMIDRDIFGPGDYGDYGISLYGGKIAFGTTVGADSNASTICSSVTVADGQWHHIAVTRNGSSGQLRIFVDGVQRAQGSGAAGNISYRVGRATSYPNSDPYLVLGAEKHDYPGSKYYNGFLDDLRISNSVRYTSDFSRPTAPHTDDANTVALYRFNEGAGTTIIDEKGQSNGTRLVNGSNGAPQWSTDTPFTGPVSPTPVIRPTLDPNLDRWCDLPMLIN